jgi:hypothetical protein
MKTKHFIDAEEAIKFAHGCQLNGITVSLMIRANNFTVCRPSHEEEFMTNTVHIERFKASKDKAED